jgi:hypothetical protein
MPWEFLEVRNVLFGQLTSSLQILPSTDVIHQSGIYPSGWLRCGIQLDILGSQREAIYE